MVGSSMPRDLDLRTPTGGLLFSPQEFAPTASNKRCDVWWALTHSCIENMLGTIGFKVVDRISSTAECNEEGKITKRKNLAIVAKRVAGAAEGLSQDHQSERSNAA